MKTGRMTPARKRALEIARDGAIRAKAALAQAAECSTGVVDGLVASGNLALDQTDFGITPLSILAGAIQVQDRVDVRFTIRAREVAG